MRIPQSRADLRPVVPQQRRERAEEPSRLFSRVLVKLDVGVFDDPLAILLQDTVREALLLLRVRLGRFRGNALLLPLDQLLDGADLRHEERGNVDAGAQGVNVAFLEGLPQRPGLEVFADVSVVLLADFLYGAGDFPRSQLFWDHNLS